MVFGGDFCQVLPVLKFGSAEQIKNANLSRSELWRDMSKEKLIENMRVRARPDTQSFVDFLLHVGSGTQPTVTVGLHDDYIEIPDTYLFKPHLTGDLSEK